MRVTILIASMKLSVDCSLCFDIVIQNIEEQALATYNETLPLWLCYVDDTITALRKNKINEFHESLNKQNTSIQFTKEIEENG